NTIVTNISGEDVTRKRVLCKRQLLAAQGDTLNLAIVNQQIHAEPTITALFTPIPTDLRPDEPTIIELVLTEDKSEFTWQTSLKRSIETLEVDLKQKKQEAHAIKKKIEILKKQL
ncbi:hypothetical protein BCV72DRAFT_283404, partial [Rhizopus microsporus var. microsporus]